MQNKKSAFSLVEIIIAIAIITLLAVIGMSYNQGYKDKTDNTKIVSDIETINNALESYAQDNTSLPMPGGNTNFFKIDTSYAHSYTGATTFGVYGSITEDTLPKKYLDTLPLDPRTNNYYSYGKTKGTAKIVANQFEIASVQLIDGEYQAKVSGNYTAEAGPYNLIREYNGSNFVYDKSKTNLPYNPEELILIATADGVVYRENDTIEATSGDLEIFFSDGSVSVLEGGGELTLEKLSFPNENNLNTFVKLSLGAGTIWTKATHLNDGSEFEVYTTDSTAAVRGTIFGVKKDSLTAPTEVFVVEGEVEVYRNDDYKTKIVDLTKDESVRVLDGRKEGTAILNISDYTNIENNFIVQEDIRGAETVAMINQEIIERENDNNVIPDVDTGVAVPNCTDGVTTTTAGNLITTLTCNADVETTSYDCVGGFHMVGLNTCENNIQSCSIGSLTGGSRTWNTSTNSYGACTVTENNITPGTSKIVSLTGAFDIELIVDSVPNLTGTNVQYLLYGTSDFKFFFETSNQVCFKKGGETKICKTIGADKKITISRNGSDEISLNSTLTGRSVSGEISLLKIGYFPLGDSQILKMDSSNRINFKIIR